MNRRTPCSVNRATDCIATNLCSQGLQNKYLPTKNIFLQDKIPYFAGLFSFLQDTPGLFKTYLKYYWPYTSNTLNCSILYQNAKHKFCRTLSRICKTAGYYFKAKKQDSPAKSRTVGNYENTWPVGRGYQDSASKLQ